MRGRHAHINYTTTSVFGNVGNCEAFCLALAVSTVGELSERERRVAVELSHALSSVVIDHEHRIRQQDAEIDRLSGRVAELILELQRCLNGGAA